MNAVAGLNTRTLGVSRDMIMAAALALGGKYLLVQDDPDLVAQAAANGLSVIYRQSQDETLSLDPAAFVAERAKNAPAAKYLHLTNELDPTPELLAWTMEAMKYANQQRLGLVIHNFSTGRTTAQWNAARANALYAAQHGHANGLHVYADNNGRPDAETFLSIKHAVGGVWLVTEFGYALDAYHGWRGKLSEAQYADFCRAWLPTFAAENMPVLLFSFDHWPANEAGKAHGFGVHDAPDFLKALASLNQQYPLKETIPMPDIPVPTTGARGALVKLPGSFLNVRAQPSTDAKDVGDLRKGEPLVFGYSDRAPGWVHITRTADDVAGWVFLQGGNVEFAPDEAPEPTPELPRWTKEQAASLRGASGVLLQLLSEVDPANSGATF